MDLIKVISRKEALDVLRAHYQAQGRDKTPPFETYSLRELCKCIELFKINLVMKKIEE